MSRPFRYKFSSDLGIGLPYSPRIVMIQMGAQFTSRISDVFQVPIP